MPEDIEAFENGKKEAVKACLNAANIIAETAAIAPADCALDAYVNFLVDTTNLLRDISDKIDPPKEDWPDKVVPLARQKKRRK